MKAVLCCFAAHRYWTDERELNQSFAHIKNEMADICQEAYLIDDNFDLCALELHAEDLMIAIPMSGAVQPKVLKIAEMFNSVLLYTGYIKDSFKNGISEKMLINNAAPAVMDVYAVMKRRTKNVHLCTSMDEVQKRAHALCVANNLRGTRLLAIGKTEPWVISSVRDWKIAKDKLGIEIIDVDQNELADIYESLGGIKTASSDEWINGASGIIEPTNECVANASRMQQALLKLIDKYKAQGAAIACFDLLRLNTTACLGVSYINTYTDYVISCEGDMDSAITMLIMKRLSKSNVWMANPNLQSNGTVNFVHCTAPTAINGEKCSYVLRNHHESGIGVSTQVELPRDIPMTACRISNDLSQMTVHGCVGICGEYEHSCRTQLTVKLDDFEKYVKNALGCHQVFVFRDITKELTYAADALGIEVL